MKRRSSKVIYRTSLQILLVFALVAVLCFLGVTSVSDSGFYAPPVAEASGVNSDAGFTPSNVGDFVFFNNGESTLGTTVPISAVNGFTYVDSNGTRKYTYHHYHGFYDSLSQTFQQIDSYNGNSDVFGGYLSDTVISSHTIAIYAYIKLDPIYVRLLKAGTLALSSSSLADLGTYTETDQDLCWGLSIWTGDLSTADNLNPLYTTFSEFQAANNMGYSAITSRASSGVTNNVPLSTIRSLSVADTADENSVYIRVGILYKTTSTLFRDYSPFIRNLRIGLVYTDAYIFVGKTGVGGSSGGKISNVTATIGGVAMGATAVSRALQGYDATLTLTATEHVGYNFLGWYVSDDETLAYADGTVTNGEHITADSYDANTRVHTLTVTAYDHGLACTDPDCTLNHTACRYAETGRYYYAVFTPKAFQLIMHGNGGLYNGSAVMYQTAYFDEFTKLVNGDRFVLADSGFMKWTGDKYVGGVVNGTNEYYNFASVTHYVGYLSASAAVSENGGRFTYASQTGAAYDLYAVWGGGMCSNTEDIAPYLVKADTYITDGYVNQRFLVSEPKAGHEIANVYAVYGSNIDNEHMRNRRVQLERTEENGSVYYTLPYVSGDFSVYIEWRAVTYTISYADTDGWLMPASYENTYFAGLGITADRMPMPTRSGYIFCGWSRKSGGDPIQDIAVDFYGDLTLYLLSREVDTDDVKNSYVTADDGSQQTVSTSNAETWDDDVDGSGPSTVSLNGYSGMGVSYTGLENEQTLYLFNTVYIGGELGVALRQGRAASVTATATINVGGHAIGFLVAFASGSESGNVSIWAGDDKSAYQTDLQNANGVSGSYYRALSWQTNSGTISTGALNLNSESTAFTIGLKMYTACTTLIWESAQYAICTSLKYTVTIAGMEPYLITYDLTSAGGDSFEGKNNVSAPWTPTSREYYEFIGWATSVNATSPTYLVGESLNFTGNATLYPVWRAKSYTLITYDVFMGSDAAASGDLGYVKKIRYPYYKTYGEDVPLSTDVANWEQLHSRAGFTQNISATLHTCWYTTLAETRSTSNGVTTVYATLSGNIATISATTVGNVSTLVYYAYWLLDAPSVATANTVATNGNGGRYVIADYGTPVTLDDKVSVSHGSEPVNISYLYSWRKGSGNNYNSVSFYGSEHILYDATESSSDGTNYRTSVTAVFSENGVTLRSTLPYNRTGNTAAFTVTISPIHLVMTDSDTEYVYNGGVQEVSMIVDVDENYYDGRQKVDDLGNPIAGSFYTVDEIVLMKAILDAEEYSVTSYYEATAVRGGLFTYNILYYIPYFSDGGICYDENVSYALSDTLTDENGYHNYEYIDEDDPSNDYDFYVDDDLNVIYAIIGGNIYLYDVSAAVIEDYTAVTYNGTTVYVGNPGTEGIFPVTHFTLTTEIKNAGRYLVSNLTLKRKTNLSPTTVNTALNYNYCWTNSDPFIPQTTTDEYQFTVNKINSTVMLYDFDKVYDGTDDIISATISNVELIPEDEEWAACFIGVLTQDFLTTYKAYFTDSVLIETATYIPAVGSGSATARYLVSGNHTDNNGEGYYVISLKWAANGYRTEHYYVHNNYSFRIINERGFSTSYSPTSTENELDEYDFVTQADGATTVYEYVGDGEAAELPSFVARLYVKPIELSLDWSAAEGLVYNGTEQGLRVTVKATSGTIVSSDAAELYLSYARTLTDYQNGGSSVYLKEKETSGIGGITTNTYFFSAVDAGSYSVFIGGVSDGNYLLSDYVVDLRGEITYDEFGNPVAADYLGEWTIAQRAVTAAWTSTDASAPNNFSAMIYNSEQQGVRLNIGNLVYNADATDRDWVSFALINLTPDTISTLLTTATQISALSADTQGSGYNNSYIFTAADYGSYNVEISGISASNVRNTQLMTALSVSVDGINYRLNGSISRNWNIVRYTLSNDNIVADTALTFVYDGETHTLLFHLIGVDSQIIQVLAYENNTGINVGTYVAEAVTLSDTNYIIASEGITQEWSITPRELTVVWAYTAGDVNGGWIYDGTAHGVTATLGNIVSQNGVADTVTPGVTTDVATVSGINNIVNGGAATFTSVSANAVSYSVTLTGVLNTDNYVLPNSGVSAEFDINSRTLTVNWDYTTSGVNSYVYDALQHGAVATVGNIILADTRNLSFTAATTATARTPSASSNTSGAFGVITLTFTEKNVCYSDGEIINYVAEISGIYSNTNYDLTDAVLNCEWIITQREIATENIGWGVTQFTYDGTAKAVTASVTNKAGTDTLGVSVITATTSDALTHTDAINAGAYYTIVDGLTNNPYYNYVLTARHYMAFTIVTRQLSFTWGYTAGADGGSFVYNGAAHGATLTVANLISGDTLYITVNDGVNVFNYNSVGAETVTVSETNVRVNAAGTAIDYNPEVTSIGNANYNIPSNDSTTFIITKRRLSIDASTGWTYSTAGVSSYVYDGSLHGVSVQIGNIITGDEPSFGVYSTGTTPTVTDGYGTVTAVSESGGIYAANITFGAINYNATAYVARVESVLDNNYLLPITDLSRTYSIAQRALTLTWGYTAGASVGAFTYDGVSHGVTATVGNAVAGDRVYFRVSTTAAAYSPLYSAGVAGGLSDGEAISFTSVDYGGYTANILTVSAVESNNYRLGATTVSSSFNITKRALTATWDFVSSDAFGVIGTDGVTGVWTYDGFRHGARLTVSGIVTGDVLSFETSTTGTSASGAVTDGTGSTAEIVFADVNVGASAYSVSVISVDDANYTFSSTSSQYTVNKREVSVVYTNLGVTPYVYNGAAQGIKLTIGNIVSGDVVGFIVSGSGTLPVLTDGTLTVNHTAADTGSIDLDFTAVNYGSYTAEVRSVVGNANYRLPSAVSGSWSIGKYTVEIVWAQGAPLSAWLTDTEEWSVIYDRTAHYVTASVADEVAGDNITLILNNASATDAGTYVASVVGFANDDYNNYAMPASGLTKTYIILPKGVTLTWYYDGTVNGTTVVYDGQLHTVTVVAGGVLTGDVISLNYTNNANYCNTATNAGEYTAQVTFDRAAYPNYTIPVGADTYGYEITPRELTLAWTSGEFTYNGTEQGNTLTVGNIVNSERIILNLVVPTGYTKPTTSSHTTDGSSSSVQIRFLAVNAALYGAAGIASVADTNGNLTGGGNCNYYLPQTGLTETLSIEKRLVAISWQSNRSFTYNGVSQGVTATVTNTVGSDVVTLNYVEPTTENGSLVYQTVVIDDVTYKMASSAVEQGDYFAEISGFSVNPNGNYRLPEGEETALETVTWRIVSRVIGISVGNAYDMTYNGSGQGATVTFSNIVAGDEAALEFTASILCALRGGSEPYSENVQIVYDAANPLTTISGVTTVSITYRFNYINAGTYTASVTGNAPSGGNGNYSYALATNRTVSFTINPKAVGIIFSADALTPVWSIDGYVYSTVYTRIARTVYCATDATTLCVRADTGLTDTVVLTYSAASVFSATDVGEYAVTVSAIDNYNYILPSSGASLVWSITQKTVTLTWSGDLTSVYDGQQKSVTAAVEGVISGDTVNATLFRGTTDGVTYTDIARNAGAYTAKVGSIDNANYALPAVTTQVWSITAREAVIGWGNASFVYDGTAKKVTATVVNAVEGDNVTLLTITAETSDATVHADRINQGTDNYTIITGFAVNPNSNYSLPQEGLYRAFTITARTLTLVWEYTTSGVSGYVYDGTIHGATVVISNIVSGDSLTFAAAATSGVTVSSLTVTSGTSFSISFTALNALVAEYTAEITGFTSNPNGNYSLTASSCEWTIEARTLSLTWSYTTAGVSAYVYDGAYHGATVAVSNVLNGETVGLTAATTLGIVTNGTSGMEDGDAATFTALNYYAAAYTVSLSGVSNTNYKLPSSGLSAAFTIARRALTVSWGYYTVNGNPTDGAFTYDGTSHGVSAVIANAVSGDAITFGTATSATVTTENGATSVVNGVTVTEITVNFTSVNYKATAYTAEITSVSSDNYYLPATGLSSSYTILKRALGVSWAYSDGTTGEFIYDRLTHGVTATVTNLVATDSVSLSIVTTGTAPAYGESVAVLTGATINTVAFTATQYSATAYTAEITAVIDDNYSLPASGLSGSWSIAKRGVGVTWKLDASETLSTIYNGAVHTVTATATNVVSPDNVVLTLSGSTATLAGSYVATITAISNTNYYVSVAQTANYVINRREVTAEIITDFTYSAVALTVNDMGVSFVNRVPTETLEYTLTFGGAALTNGYPLNAASYTATIVLTADAVNDNYTLTNSGEALGFVINPHTLARSSFNWYHTISSRFYSDEEAITDDFNVTYFGSGYYQGFYVNSVSDSVYNLARNNLADNLSFTYYYFGFCTCGQYYNGGSSVYTYHSNHQWLMNGNSFRTSGPYHAGSYWIVTQITGDLKANFRFDDLDEGYTDTTYFTTNASGNPILLYPNTNVTAMSSLPTGYVLPFSINQAVGGLSPSDSDTDTKVFDGEDYNEAPTITGISQSDVKVFVNSVQMSYADYIANSDIRDVGVYDVQFTTQTGASGTGWSGTSCDYYNGTLPTVEITVTVTAKTVTVTSNSSPPWKKVYDATTDFTYYTVGSGDIVDATLATVTAAYASADVGVREITFTVIGSDSGNYVFSITGDDDTLTPSTVTGEIIPQEISVIHVSADDWSKVYDGTTVVYGYTVNQADILANAPVTVTAAYDSDAAGDRTVDFTISGAHSGNYVLVCDGSEITTVDTEIFRKGVTLTNTVFTKVYDGTTVADFTVSTNDILIGDDADVVGVFADKNVGTNKSVILTFIGTDAANYKFGANGTTEERVLDTLTEVGAITRRVLTANWSDLRTSNVYSGVEVSVGLTLDNIVYNEAVTISISGTANAAYTSGGVELYSIAYTFTGTHAGEYTASGALLSDNAVNSNYVITQNAVYNWTIERRQVAAVWTGDALGTWSNDFETDYNALQRTVTPTIGAVDGVTDSGIISGDTLSTVITGNTQKSAGQYTAAITVGNADYILVSGGTRVYTILVINVEGITIADLSTVYNGTFRAITVSGNVTSLGDVAEVTYTITPDGGVASNGNSAKNAGVYTISATLTNPNYNTLTLTATLTIANAEITGVTVTSLEVTYDTQVHVIAVSRTVTQYGDALTIVYTGGETAGGNGAVNAGEYEITVSLSAANYNNLTIYADLIINKADIEGIGTLSDYTVTYTGGLHSITLTNAVVVTQYGHTVSVVYKYDGVVASGKVNAGTYAVTATVTALENDVASANYNVITYSATLTVNKAVMANVADGGGFYFGNQTENADFTDTITYNALYNYLKPLSNETSTVTERVVNSKLRTIGIQPAVDGVVLTDEATLSYTVGGVEFNGAKYVGSYEITVVFTNNNYVGESFIATLNITAAAIEGLYLNGYSETYLGDENRFGIGVSRSATDVVYTAVNTVTLFGTDTATVTYTYSTVYDGAYSAFTYVTDAGTYYIRAEVTANGTASGNYIDLTGNNRLTATIIINRGNLNNVTMQSVNTVYNGAMQYVYVESVTGGGTVYTNAAYGRFGDELTLSYSVTPAGGTASEGHGAVNAGNYSVSAVINAADGANYNSNYESLTLLATLVIDKAEIYGGLTVYSNSDPADNVKTVTYDKNAHYVRIVNTEGAPITTSADGNIIIKPSGSPDYAGDAAAVTFTRISSGAAFESAVNAGTYTVRVALDTANYVKFEAIATLIIEKAVMLGDVYFESAEGYTLVYDAQYHYLSVQTSAGSPVVVSSAESVLYSLTVSPYAGADADHSDTATVRYIRNGADFSGAKNVGAYTVTARLTNDNYVTADYTATLTVTAYSLGSLYYVGNTFTYDANNHYAYVSATDAYSTTAVNSIALLNGDGTASVNYRYNSTAVSDPYLLTFTSARNAAVYYLQATVSADSGALTNYCFDNLTADGGEYKLNTTLTVNRAPLNIYFVGAEFTYNADMRYAYVSTFNAYAASAEVIRLLGSDGVLGVSYSYATTAGGVLNAFSGAKNAGTYYIAATFTNSADVLANYDTDTVYASYASSEPTAAGNALKATLTINKAEVPTRYFVGNENLIYKGTPYYIGLSTTNAYLNALVTGIDLLYSETASVIYTYNTDGGSEYPLTFTGATDAATYYVKAELSATGDVLNNYNIGTAYTAVLTVNKVKFDGSSGNLRGYYFVGTELGYDSYLHAVGVNARNAWINDQGTYRTVTLVNNETATFAYTVMNGGTEEVFTGAVNAGTYALRATLTATEGVNLNNYDLDTLYGAGNTYFGANLIINKVKATVLWTGGAQFTYNGTDQSDAISASFSGVGNDGVQQMELTFLGGYNDDTVFLNGGTYSVTASAVVDNYDFSGDTERTYVMNRATVAWQVAGYTTAYDSYYHYLGARYNESRKNDDVNATGDITLLASDSATLVYKYNTDGGSDYVNTFTGAVNSGTYYVKVTLIAANAETLLANNYSEWVQHAVLKITMITIGATGEDWSKVYDGTTDVDWTGDNSGLQDNDAAYLTLTGAYADKYVGTDKVIQFSLTAIVGVDAATAAEKLANYVVLNVTTGIIYARELRASPEYVSWSKVYDGTSAFNGGASIVLDDGCNVVSGDTVDVRAAYNSKNVNDANKIIFLLSGADASNYYMDDVVEGVSITAATVSVQWLIDRGSGYVFTYNGVALGVSGYIGLLGEDSTLVNGGRHYLTLTITVDGESVSQIKNAGVYDVEASITDSEYSGNYALTDNTCEFTINKKSADVLWRGHTATYTYNATDQSAAIVAYIALVTADTTAENNGEHALELTFTKNSVITDFINAGTYAVSAGFADGDAESYALNYELIVGLSRTVVMNKAAITSIVFNTLAGAIVTEPYYTGTPHYYYVTASGGTDTYATAYGGEAYYQYEYANGVNLAMRIVYSGGDIGDEVLNAGNNGVKNANVYRIYATVSATDNYLRWQDYIDVTVPQGDPSAYIFFNGVGNVDGSGNPVYGSGIYYNGGYQALYASNTNEISTVQTEVKYPDNTTATIAYEIINVTGGENEYSSGNSAKNASLYLIRATITESHNYEEYVFEAVNFYIMKVERSVMWLAGSVTSTSFVYDNTDQAEGLIAYIGAVGSDGVNGKIVLEFSLTSLADPVEYASHGGVDGEFRLAGVYSATAGFINDGNDYALNYEILNATHNLTMNKYSVNLLWEIGNDDKGYEVYSDLSEYVYDGTAFNIRVTAYGLITDAEAGTREEIPIILPYGADDPYLTAVLLGGHTYSVSSVSAGEFLAIVKDIDATEYDYAYNYKLPTSKSLIWNIQKRQLAMTFINQYISKIYDGSEYFDSAFDSVTFGIDENGYRTVTFLYNVASSAGYIRFILDNIIIGDEGGIVSDVAIMEIAANAANVLATAAVITFDTFDNENYYITLEGATTLSKAVPAEIIPRDITMYVAHGLGHVYNGQTFLHELEYSDGISTVVGTIVFDRICDYDNITYITELITGNYFIGRISLIPDEDGNNRDVGSYEYQIDNFHTEDKYSAQNYNVYIAEHNETYTISSRALKLSYSNTLQSLQANTLLAVDISAVNDGATGDNAMTATDFAALMEADSVLSGGVVNGGAFLVVNGWQSDVGTLTGYTRYIGGEDVTKLLVAFGGDNEERNIRNYTIGQPILQITYINIDDADNYVFSVETQGDVMNLAADVSGLNTAYGYNAWGLPPTYIQKNDIDMIASGNASFVPIITEFGGTYNGGGYTIYNYDIVSSATENVGFIGRLTGTVTGLNFRYASINAYGALNVGGVAGVVSGGTVSASSFQGAIYAYTTSGGNVGGIVGLIDGGATVTSVKVVGTIVTNATGAVGGVVGEVAGASGDAIVIAGAASAAVVTVTGNASYVGGITGTTVAVMQEYEMAVTVSDVVYVDGIVTNNGTAVAADDYAESLGALVTAGDEIIALLYAYEVRDCYLGDAYDTFFNSDFSDDAGSNGAAIVIGNWRQYILETMYPYFTFTVESSIYIPPSVRYNGGG